MNENSNLPKSIYYFFIVIIFLVTPVALGLIFMPQTFGPNFFWALKPFNTRFLGVFYTAEMIAVASLLYYKTWSPARFALRAACLFTGWATCCTLFMHDQVIFTKPWRMLLWYILYAGSFVITAYFTYSTRKCTIQQSMYLTGLQKSLWLIHTIFMLIHFIGLLVDPVPFSAGYWPWSLDVFSGRFYAGLFLLALYGNYLLYTGAHKWEYKTYGLLLIVFGFGAILSMMLVDASVHKVDWNSLGTWFWVGSSGISGFIGLTWVRKSGQ